MSIRKHTASIRRGYAAAMPTWRVYGYNARPGGAGLGKVGSLYGSLKGFATVAQWGRHRWFCLVVLLRRVSVLACFSVARRQILDGLGQEEPVSELLESMAHVPDDVLRVIVGFVGEG